jgi:hypothetical protein
MKKVRLFADCFKTKYNCRVWINPNFKLDFLPKVVTNLFKTTSTVQETEVSKKKLSDWLHMRLGVDIL